MSIAIEAPSMSRREAEPPILQSGSQTAVNALRALIFALCVFATLSASGQSGSGTLQGTVLDPNGAE